MAKCGFAAVINEDKVLLVQIAPPYTPAHYWNFPGGVIELSEQIEHGVAREVLEETGIVCAVGPLVESFTTPDNEIYRYKATFVSGTITIQESEIEAAGWFSFQEALKLPLAFDVRSQIETLQQAASHAPNTK